MIKFELPKNVKFILDEIHASGEEAYIVGGCVRDLLLNHAPADWDITTSAMPDKVKAVFRKTVDTGLEHGTVSVLVSGEAFEVTTYRIDGKYEDYRRPKEVVFTPSLKEDLLRRDFTINAMAYNEEKGIIDPYDGQKDLEKKIIRCVGVPKDRFQEDALRMLRAIRFSAKLGFEIEIETYDAIKELSYLIEYVSEERIQVELTKTLMSPSPEKIEEIVKTGLVKYTIPEFESIIGLEQNNPYHEHTVDQHTYIALMHVPALKSLRWTMYLHDIGKGRTKTTDENGIDHFRHHQKVSADMAKKILKRLKFDNKTIERVHRLIVHHDDPLSLEESKLRKTIHRIDQDYFSDLLQIKQADIYGRNANYKEKHLKEIHEIRALYDHILRREDCLSIRELDINGHDVMKLGVKGKAIGEVLNKLLDIVLEEPELNEYKKLVVLAKGMIR